jgi:hypothetical protein
VDGKPFADDSHILDRDRGRKDGREKRMQCAAKVRIISAMFTVLVGTSIVGVVMRAMFIDVRARRNERSGWRRGDDTRKLGENKHSHQQMDKTANHLQPLR